MLRKSEKNKKNIYNLNFGGTQQVYQNETIVTSEEPRNKAEKKEQNQPDPKNERLKTIRNILALITAILTLVTAIITLIHQLRKSDPLPTQNTSVEEIVGSSSEMITTVITTETETQAETTTEPTEETTTTARVYRYLTYTDTEKEGTDKGWTPYIISNGTNAESIRGEFGEKRTTTEKPSESEDLRIVDTTPIIEKQYTYSAASPGAGWELVDSTWYFDGQPVAYDHELQSAPNIRFDHKESVAYKYKIVTRQFNDSGEELEPVSETTGWLDHPMETSDSVTLVDQQFKWYYLHGTQKYVKTTTTGTIYTYQVMQYKTIYWWIIESFEPIAETDKIKPYDGN